MINKFQALKIGSCFKYLEANRVSKHIPFEYIKESVLNWFEKYINIYDLQYDKIQGFDEFRKIVLKKYYSEMDRITNVIDEVIKKSDIETKPSLNKFELFKSRWNQWFGIANIVIYNRFVEKTTFK